MTPTYPSFYQRAEVLALLCGFTSDASSTATSSGVGVGKCSQDGRLFPLIHGWNDGIIRGNTEDGNHQDISSRPINNNEQGMSLLVNMGTRLFHEFLTPAYCPSLPSSLRRSVVEISITMFELLHRLALGLEGRRSSSSEVHDDHAMRIRSFKQRLTSSSSSNSSSASPGSTAVSLTVSPSSIINETQRYTQCCVAAQNGIEGVLLMLDDGRDDVRLAAMEALRVAVPLIMPDGDDVTAGGIGTNAVTSTTTTITTPTSSSSSSSASYTNVVNRLLLELVKMENTTTSTATATGTRFDMLDADPWIQAVDNTLRTVAVLDAKVR